MGACLLEQSVVEELLLMMQYSQSVISVLVNAVVQEGAEMTVNWELETSLWVCAGEQVEGEVLFEHLVELGHC